MIHNINAVIKQSNYIYDYIKKASPLRTPWSLRFGLQTKEDIPIEHFILTPQERSNALNMQPDLSCSPTLPYPISRRAIRRKLSPSAKHVKLVNRNKLQSSASRGSSSYQRPSPYHKQKMPITAISEN